MTEHEYRQSGALQSELITILGSKAMKEAISVLANEAKPKRVVAFQAGTPLDTHIAHHYQFIRGIQYALDKLETLTKPLEPERKEEDETPYLHSLPREYQDAIKKLNQP